jgi:hypothetical protein
MEGEEMRMRWESFLERPLCYASPSYRISLDPLNCIKGKVNSFCSQLCIEGPIKEWREHQRN